MRWNRTHSRSNSSFLARRYSSRSYPGMTLSPYLCMRDSSLAAVLILSAFSLPALLDQNWSTDRKATIELQRQASVCYRQSGQLEYFGRSSVHACGARCKEEVGRDDLVMHCFSLDFSFAAMRMPGSRIGPIIRNAAYKYNNIDHKQVTKYIHLAKGRAQATGPIRSSRSLRQKNARFPTRRNCRRQTRYGTNHSRRESFRQDGRRYDDHGVGSQRERFR